MLIFQGYLLELTVNLACAKESHSVLNVLNKENCSNLKYMHLEGHDSEFWQNETPFN